MADEGPFTQVVKGATTTPATKPEAPAQPSVGPFSAVVSGTQPTQFSKDYQAVQAQRTQPEGSFLTRALKGGFELNKAVLTGAVKGVVPEQIAPEGFYQPTVEHPTAEAIGEFGSTAATALSAYGLGKAALTRVLAANSPRVAAFLAQTGAETIPLVQPGLLRAGASIGGSVGFGAEQGVREALEGGSPADIAKRAGGATALSLGGDAAAYSIARALRVAPRDPRLLFGQASEKQIAALGAVERELAQAQQQVVQKTLVINKQLQTGTFKDPTVLTDLMAANAKANQLVLDRSKMAFSSKAFSTVQAQRVVYSQAEKALAEESVKLGVKVQELTTDEMTAQIRLGFQKLMGTPKGAISAEKTLTEVQKTLGETRIREAQTGTDQQLMLRASRGEVATPPSANFYLSDRAGNGGKWLYGMVQLSEHQDQEASRFMAKLLKSPDSVARSNGLSMGVLGNESIEASAATRLRANRFRNDMSKLWGELAATKGIGAIKSRIPTASWARDIREVHELHGGVAGVHQQFGPKVGTAWEAIINRRDLEMAEAEKVAGALRMGPAEKVRLLGPTGDYFPQVPIPKDYLLRTDPRPAALVRLRAAQGRPIAIDEAREILNKLESNRRAGLRKVGNLDFERNIPGSTGQKVAAGWKMLDDPRQVMEIYGDGLAHRIEYARRFGNNLELVDAIKEAARQEGANMAEVHTAADLMTGATYFDSAFRNATRKLTTIQVLEKMGLAALPNLSQQVNTVLFAGVKNFTKGLASFRSSTSRERVLEGLAAQEGVLSALEHATMEGGRPDKLGLFATGLLKLNAFSPVENLNREVGMMVSQAVAKDLIAKGLAGRLKGATLSHARNQAASLGFDLSKVLQRGGQFTDIEFRGLLDSAIARGARETQFVPDLTRLPYYWQHPYGRLFLQFKSFGFSQAKFVRDAVFREALEGNMKPLAYYLTMYPMAGEMVASSLDAIRGKSRRDSFNPTAPFTDLDRYVTTMASVGAMGIAWNIYTGAKYDNLFTALVGGPTVGDVNDVAKAAFGPHPARDLVKKAQRSPSYRFGELAFKMVAYPIEKMVEAAKASMGDESPASAKSLEQLLMESTQEKRGAAQ